MNHRRQNRAAADAPGRSIPAAVASRLVRLHRDQGGSMSIPSMFALVLLAFLLGMVMNSGRQVDQKVKMQNAADAATYSGGVVLTRGMNTLAFTNHLISDVFALTAFMREGAEHNAESQTGEILANWARIGPPLSTSEFEKFAELGLAISEKVPHEAEMVRTYGVWAEAASDLMLPVLEEILEYRMIPEYQRAVVRTTPRLAQYATAEIARRHGRAWHRSHTDTELRGVLWRTDVEPVGGPSELDPMRRTLPVVDPVMDMLPDQSERMKTAKEQRDSLAKLYLRQWNNESIRAFDKFGKMSQFSNLWRIFTCGQLEKLLNEEYPRTNLPHLIRTPTTEIDDVNRHLEQKFMFVGVVYRNKIKDRVPGIFKNPVPTDTQAYAQIMVFVPRRRLIKVWMRGSSSTPSSERRLVSVPGDEYVQIDDPTAPPPPTEEGEEEPEWRVVRQSGSHYPEYWDLLNQNWTTQLAPATVRTIPAILSTSPNINGINDVNTPNLWALTEEDFQWLSNH